MLDNSIHQLATSLAGNPFDGLKPAMSEGDQRGSLWQRVFDQAQPVQAQEHNGQPASDSSVDPHGQSANGADTSSDSTRGSLDTGGERFVTSSAQDAPAQAPMRASKSNTTEPSFNAYANILSSLEPLSSAASIQPDAQLPLGSYANIKTAAHKHAVASAEPSPLAAHWTTDTDGQVRLYLRAQLRSSTDALILASQLRNAATSLQQTVTPQTIYWNGKPIQGTEANQSQTSGLFNA